MLGQWMKSATMSCAVVLLSISHSISSFKLTNLSVRSVGDSTSLSSSSIPPLNPWFRSVRSRSWMPSALARYWSAAMSCMSICIF
ncbi:hypothetical protein F5H01DRAFT_352174 [Linnemannia elongata]|nr:hypothetical protein F5H01DRAFT_352174 [Linnemannia elongata]